MFGAAPLFKHLEFMEKHRKTMGSTTDESKSFSLSFASLILHKPKYYKLKWWIFHAESPAEGIDFMKDEHAICTADAMILMEKLREQGKPYLIYNKSQPRLPKDGTPPWDINAKRWKGHSWAPNWHDDQDPEWNGHK